jgi:hypothetical protein
MEGQRIGMVDRLQRNTGPSASEGRLLPVGGTVGNAPSVPWFGEGHHVAPGLGAGGGAHAGEGIGGTYGNRDETTIKESGPSSVARVQLGYDVTLHVKNLAASGQVAHGVTVMLPGAGTGHAYLQMFNDDLAGAYHRLETRALPLSWSEGPPVDRVWMALDRRDGQAPTFNLDAMVGAARSATGVRGEVPYLTIADQIRTSLGPVSGSDGGPLIRLTATGTPDAATQARMIAVTLGAEAILDVTGPGGQVEHYRIMPDGSLHSVDPDRGFAASVGTLPPDLRIAAAKRGLDLHEVYQDAAGQHRSFAQAVRDRLGLPDQVPGMAKPSGTAGSTPPGHLGTAVHYGGV